MSNTQPRSLGFTLVELISVVALLSILGSFALVGVRRNVETANFKKVLRDLSDVDLAKQTWAETNPDSTFPSDEPSRWTTILPYLPTGTPATASDTTSLGGVVYLAFNFSTNKFSPNGYYYAVGRMTQSASAIYNGSAIIRP